MMQVLKIGEGPPLESMLKMGAWATYDMDLQAGRQAALGKGPFSAASHVVVGTLVH